MTKFKLPKGYSFEPPADELVNIQGVTIPPFGLYGGSAVTQDWDANGVHFVGCNASKTSETPAFKWRVFKKQGSGYVEVPLPFLATGRGTQGAHLYDGKAHAIAWEQKDFNFAEVPGFVAFPSIPSLAARIAALEAGGGGGVEGRAPIVIAADSPLGRLYVGPPYLPEHFDTPEETAKRMQKLLEALLHVRALLIATGVARLE